MTSKEALELVKILYFNINEKTIQELNRTSKIYDKLYNYITQQEKQEKLLDLYKEFFDKLNIQLRNTFDIDYIYPHEFIIGYDIKSEDKELVKLFKQIKELENE